MNLAEAAELILTLSLKDEVSSGLKGIQTQLDKTNTKAGSLQGGLSKIGQGIGKGVQTSARIGAVGLGLLFHEVDAGIDSLVELEDVQLQTEAAIKSTGGTAGKTKEDIRRLAQEYEELTGVDDKVIQSGENLLLTFQNIKGDGFDAALQAALDMSEAMDQDLNTSILQIGKALNDPEKGLAALGRVGVSFDDNTKKIIKDMIDTGDTAGAQKLIIQELNEEFGGSAQASMEGYRGTQLRLKDTWEDLQQTLAQAVLPALDTVSRKLRRFLQNEEVKDGIKKLGEGIAGLFSNENIDSGVGALKDLFNFLKDLPWNQIKEGMGFAADNAKRVVDVFKGLPPGVQAGLLTFLAANKLTGGLVASGLGELAKVALSSLKTITAANVTVIGANVTGGGAPGAPSIPGGPVGPATIVGAAGAVTGIAIAGGALALGITSVVDEIRLGNTYSLDEKNLIHQIDIKEGELTNLQRYANFQTQDQQQRLRDQIAGMRAELAARHNERVQQEQRQTLVASEISERISTTNQHQTRLIDLSADSDQRLERLDGIHANQLEQKRLAQIAALKLSESKERLDSIQISSQRTAQKNFDVTVNVRSQLTIAGRVMAEAVDHFRRTQGGQV